MLVGIPKDLVRTEVLKCQPEESRFPIPRRCLRPLPASAVDGGEGFAVLRNVVEVGFANLLDTGGEDDHWGSPSGGEVWPPYDGGREGISAGGGRPPRSRRLRRGRRRGRRK